MSTVLSTRPASFATSNKRKLLFGFSLCVYGGNEDDDDDVRLMAFDCKMMMMVVVCMLAMFAGVSGAFVVCWLRNKAFSLLKKYFYVCFQVDLVVGL